MNQISAWTEWPAGLFQGYIYYQNHTSYDNANMPPVLPPGEFHVLIKIFSNINGTATTIVNLKMVYDISPVGVVDFWTGCFSNWVFKGYGRF